MKKEKSRRDSAASNETFETNNNFGSKVTIRLGPVNWVVNFGLV
jgi:hypothetical protein